MDLTHEFTVPVDAATAWEAFQDISSVAECFPGAKVTSFEGDSFEGTCKVKLGPVALQYAGSGTFVERDQASGRMVLDAKGRDKRGNGTAGAHVTATFTDAGGGSTRVEVVTDLQITGKPAQFGRGVIQDVSDKLLGQFVDCLEAKVSAPEPAPAESAAPAAAASPDSAAASPASSDSAAAGAADQPGQSELESSAATGPASGSAAPAAPPSSSDDALDLGATVLPALARAYWKPVAGVMLVLVVLRRLRSRRR